MRFYGNFFLGGVWGGIKAKSERLPLGARCVRFLCLATSFSKDIICSLERDIFMLVFTRQEEVRPFMASSSSRYSCLTACLENIRGSNAFFK